MGWLSSLKESLTGAAEKLGASELVSRVKEAIQGRAAEAPTTTEAPTSEFEKYFDAWKEADYRSFAVPTTPEMVYQQPLVLSRAQYAPGPEGMKSEYITSFEAAGINPETGEYELFSFGIGSEDLLTEEDVSNAASQFAEAYGLESVDAVTPIGGITRSPETEYLEL